MSKFVVIIVVFFAFFACEQNYAGINNTEIRRQLFDMEGKTIEVTNSSNRKWLTAELYLPQGDDLDVQLHQVTLRVSGGNLIDWDATVIALDSMLLAPLVELRHTSSGGQNIIITWGNIPWQSHGNNKHTISLDVMFKEDVSPGTVIEFWTSSIVFQSNSEDPVYLYGQRDIDLGQEYYSGALFRPLHRDDEEEEFMPKVPRLIVVEE